MSIQLPGIELLLPHREPMLFVDEVLRADAEQADTLVHITETSMGHVDGQGVPAWMGLEYMAQTVGIVAGMQAMEGDWELTEGYLLGTRRYRAAKAWFAAGSTLKVTGKLDLMIDAGIGSFSCAIADVEDPDLSLVQCSLTIYRNPPATDATQEQSQ